MNAQPSDQLACLQRIAAFAAGVRGHELGEWHSGEDCMQARCLACGAVLRVYASILEPDMDGPALQQPCREHAANGRAA